MPREKMKIMLVSSESVPFAKVGGLADVVGALGKEIQKNGMEVSIVIPKYAPVYEFIEEKKLKVVRSQDISVSLETGEVKGKVEEVKYEGVSYFFIDQPGYFKRSGIYVDNKTKADFTDSLERFTFFSKAALEAAKVFDFKPDIIQANDWQTGLVPVYLKTIYKLDSFYKTTKCIFSIHNLSYQGIFPVEQFTITGLDWKYFTVNGLEYYGHLNLLKGGVVFSDTIVTVSETYAKEIQTQEYGNGLEGVIKDKAQQKKLFGIVNGVDYNDWNPKVDQYLKQKFGFNYDLNSVQNKKKIKEAFLKENGVLNPDPNLPLIGVVSRLVDQKGFDLIFEIIDDVLKMGVYFTVLGIGKSEYEKKLKMIQEKYPGKTAIFIQFDIPVSHYIEAASDIFIMPSRFEPCGLNQLYSMKYGTIPVARNTGGLADTVKDGKTGILFNDYSPDDFFSSLKKAIGMFKNEPDKWQKMVENGMKEDWSWERAGKRYMELYKSLTAD